MSKAETDGRFLYEKVYCARGDMENRIKECQGDLFADRTSTATMRANQLRLWFASFGLCSALRARRIGLAHTQFAEATCGTIRLKLLKLGALVRVSARRIKFALASACPYADEWRLAARLRGSRLRRRRDANRGIHPSAHRRTETPSGKLIAPGAPQHHAPVSLSAAASPSSQVSNHPR